MNNPIGKYAGPSDATAIPAPLVDRVVSANRNLADALDRLGHVVDGLAGAQPREVRADKAPAPSGFLDVVELSVHHTEAMAALLHADMDRLCRKLGLVG